MNEEMNNGGMNNQEMGGSPANDTLNQDQQGTYSYGASDNYSQDAQWQAPEQKGQSIASLVLGLVGLVAWCIPLIGYPVTIVGIIMGVLGMKKGGRGMAIAGIILSIICLVITIINSVFGAMYAIDNLM